MNSKKPFLRNILFILNILVFIAVLISLVLFDNNLLQFLVGPFALNPPVTPVPATTQIPNLLTPTSLPNNDFAQPALLETRRLTLEFPPKIKADSASDIVRLTLEVDDLENITPTAFYAENTVTGEVIQIPNLYETHNVGVETRFDIAGLQVEPAGDVYQPLQQGLPVTFYWSIRAPQVGKFRGTIWVHLVFVDKVTGEESRRAVSAQIVDIEAVDFFGFSVNFVRTSGVIGSVLGIIVSFPFFDDVVKYLWSRRKKKKVKK
jgi:hypothetical protein